MKDKPEAKVTDVDCRLIRVQWNKRMALLLLMDLEEHLGHGVFMKACFKEEQQEDMAG